MRSQIENFTYSLQDLIDLDIPLDEGVVAIKARRTDAGSFRGRQFKMVYSGPSTGRVSEPLSEKTKEAVLSFLESNAFAKQYEEFFGVKIGEPIRKKNATEILTELEDLAEWDAIWAEYLVHGIPLIKLAERHGIKLYATNDETIPV